MKSKSALEVIAEAVAPDALAELGESVNTENAERVKVEEVVPVPEVRRACQRGDSN